MDDVSVGLPSELIGVVATISVLPYVVTLHELVLV